MMRDWLILFSVKCEFRKLFFMAHDLKVLHDFTTLFDVTLRHKSSEWLESSIETDLQYGALS